MNWFTSAHVAGDSLSGHNAASGIRFRLLALDSVERCILGGREIQALFASRPSSRCAAPVIARLQLTLGVRQEQRELVTTR